MSDRIQLVGRIEAADAPRRTITGRIVTWGEVGMTSRGPTRFAAGALTASSSGVKLLLEHQQTAPIGRALELTEHESGIDGSFRVIGTRAGDDALVEASEGLRAGLSVGAVIHESHIDHDGTLVVTAAELDEVSLVVNPAIDSARVLDVAASTPTESETEVSEPTIDPIEVDEVEVEVVEETVTASTLAPIRTTPRPVEFASPADYINTYVAAARGDRVAARRIEAANQTVADNPGIVPTPIIGNVITFLNAKRPVVATSRSIGLPGAGASFVRPYVTQHTQAGKQDKEFDPLKSQAMKVNPITVNKATYGGTLSISFQDRDWTEPEILNLVVTDMSAQYAVQTDAAAITELTTSVKQSQPLAADAKVEALIAAVAQASATIGGKIFEMPDTLYVSFDKWAYLASLCDSTGRPAFPYINPMNSAGSNGSGVRAMAMSVMGLDVVADANLPAGTMIVGRSELLETYETIGGQVSVVAPSTLSFTLAYYGYFASKVVEPLGFVALKPSA